MTSLTQSSAAEAVEMAKAGADAIIAHVGTTVGGSIGVTSAVVSWDFTIKRTQEIIDAATRVRKDIFFLCHGGPINTPSDADRVMKNTDAVGFVGASSLERREEIDSVRCLGGWTREQRCAWLPLPSSAPAPG